MKLLVDVKENNVFVCIRTLPDTYYESGGSDGIYSESFECPKNSTRFRILLEKSVNSILDRIASHKLN